MSPSIEQIIQELYQFDPKLKQYEAHLRQLIATMLDYKPDTKFDAQFASELRRRLMAQASLGREISANRFSWKWLSFGLTGVIAAAVFVLAVNSQIKDGKKIKTGPDSMIGALFASSFKTTPAGREAFGPLAAVTFAPQGAYGLGGGDSGAAASKFAGGAAMPAQFKYKYSGSDLRLNDQNVMVYERDKKFTQAGVEFLLNRLYTGGLASLRNLENPELGTLTLNENRDFGYSVTVNFQEGTVDFSQNWPKWQQKPPLCPDGKCLEAQLLKLDFLTFNSTAVEIANAFLADYRINRDPYGQPEVENIQISRTDDPWIVQYYRVQDKSTVSVPETISVVYPLMIDGNPVLDQSGRKAGLSVTISLRSGRVVSVNQLASQQYRSSEYEAETDAKQLLQSLEQPSGIPPRQGGNGQIIELGTPTKGYAKYYLPDDSGGTKELLVPSLIFPVIKAPDGSFYQQSVVVPLVKQMLEQGNN